MTRAPSGTSSGDAARVLSSLSRRATAAAPSSDRRAARTSGEAVEVQLEVGVGQHHRADVPALHHPPAVVGHPRPAGGRP